MPEGKTCSAAINIVNFLLIFLGLSFSVALDISLVTVFFSRVSSLRLAYRDLDIKAREETLNLSGKKKTELERLGMGLGSSRRYVKFWKLYLKYSVVLCIIPHFTQEMKKWTRACYGNFSSISKKSCLCQGEACDRFKF